MQTDSTEDGDFHLLLTEGLPRHGTRWARAETNPRLRELILEERFAPTVKMRVSYVGHKARDT